MQLLCCTTDANTAFGVALGSVDPRRAPAFSGVNCQLGLSYWMSAPRLTHATLERSQSGPACGKAVIAPLCNSDLPSGATMHCFGPWVEARNGAVRHAGQPFAGDPVGYFGRLLPPSGGRPCL